LTKLETKVEWRLFFRTRPRTRLMTMTGIMWLPTCCRYDL